MFMLSIDPETVQQIVAGARLFDAKEGDVDPDSGSNATDDKMIDVLGETDDDPSLQEVTRAIRGLADDEQIDLVALAWIGRGTFLPIEWAEARAEASLAHNRRTAEYLTSLPMLGDYLEEGLFGVIAQQGATEDGEIE